MADAPTPAPVDEGTVRLSKLHDALWSDKDFGAAYRAKAKEMFPDITTPEDQLGPLVAPLRGEIDKLKEELSTERDALAKERQERDEERQATSMRAALDAARTRFNLTDAGLDQMVARMKETGNYTDPEAAAAWVVQQTPPTPVSKAGYLPKRLDLFGSHSARDDEDFKMLHRDPLGYQDAQLERFAQDPDGYVRETFAA